MTIQALIFDVDGTLAETEEVHRAAFNRVFADERLDWSWDVDLYRDLLKTTGGKERMRAYAAQIGAELDDADVQRMHLAKNAHYGALTRSGKATLRPGVEILIRRGHAAGLQHQDPEPRQPGLIEQGQRDHGGLAGAGRGLQYQLVAPAQLLPEFTENLADRQVRNVVR